uniref:CDT1 Geminin-binding domain-containing protein n=1 Tax=Plectus sambesii TaxID=2011161 RepID=A0A914WRN2_9BILA
MYTTRRQTLRKQKKIGGAKTSPDGQSQVTDFFRTVRKLPSAETAKRSKLDPTPAATAGELCQVKQEAPPCSQTVLDSDTATQKSTVETANAIPVHATPEIHAATPSTDISPRKRKTARALTFEDGQKPPGSAKRQLRFPVLSEPIQNSEPLAAAPSQNVTSSQAPKLTSLQPQNGTSSKEKDDLLTLSSAQKERLKNRVRSVAGLQERLAKTSEAARRLREQQTQQKCGEVEQLKAQLSPVKAPPGAPLNASATFVEPLLPPKDYGAISRLIPEVRDATHLKLPPHYSLLATMFHDVDQVVSVMRTYNKLVTFEEVQRNVKCKLKRDFEMKHLGQIKAVYSEAYDLSLLKERDKFGQRARQDKFHLVLAPNLSNDMLGYLKPESPKKTDSLPTASQMPLTPTKLISPLKGRPFLSPSILFRPSPRKTPVKAPAAPPTDIVPQLDDQLQGWRINCRSQIFVYRLVNLVKERHREFLKQLHPTQQLTAADEAILRRWHPDFKLDAVPEVPIAPLPEPPTNGSAIRKLHMKDFLEMDQPSVQLPAKVDEVLELLKSPDKLKVLGTATTADGGAKPKDPFLARLERIRQKEREKKMAEMVRNPIEELRRGRLERLKTSMVRSMCSYYMVKKCTSIPTDDLVDKLAYSYGAIPKKEVENHLLLLAEIAPDLVTMLTISGKGKYVRLLVNDFNRIQEAVDNELKKFIK